MTFNEFKIKFTLIMQGFFRAALKYIKAARVELIVLAAVLALDLISKGVLAATMPFEKEVTVIPKFFNIYYTHNTKAAFGSVFGLEKHLSDGQLRVMFIIITIPTLAAFSYFMYRFRGQHRFSTISFALIISGALGNFIDRVFLKYVRDFFQIVFFGLDLPLLGESFAIFNIADTALVVGVIMFAIYFIFMYKTPAPAFIGPMPQKLCDDGVYRTKEEIEKLDAYEQGEKKD